MFHSEELIGLFHSKWVVEKQRKGIWEFTQKAIARVQVNIGAGLDYVPDINAGIQWENTLGTKNHNFVFFRHHFGFLL